MIFLKVAENSGTKKETSANKLSLRAIRQTDMLPRLVLLFVTFHILGGQPAQEPYFALKSDLSLSDRQIGQLVQRRQYSQRTNGFGLADQSSLALLSGAKQTKLSLIAKVLENYRMASFAISVGLAEVRQWPSFICLYPPHSFASEFGLSETQVRQLEQLKGEKFPKGPGPTCKTPAKSY